MMIPEIPLTRKEKTAQAQALAKALEEQEELKFKESIRSKLNPLNEIIDGVEKKLTPKDSSKLFNLQCDLKILKAKLVKLKKDKSTLREQYKVVDDIIRCEKDIKLELSILDSWNYYYELIAEREELLDLLM